MKSYTLTSFDSSPEIQTIQRAEPKRGEISVRVAACGLNFADLLMMSGDYQSIPERPFTLGLEYAGEVAAVGEGVTSVNVGQRVAVYAGSGGLADYAIAPAERAFVLPDTMPDTVAAGFLIAYGTSHTALVKARLSKGETLLVLGAGGGVGLTAVEIGAAIGARVIAVARGAEKAEAAKRAGATMVLEPEEDIRAAVKAEGGADVVYDPVGGDLFSASLRATRRDARLIIIGFASGQVPPIPANVLLVKNLSVIGHHWGAYASDDPKFLKDSLRTLIAWYDEGKLRPQIGHTLPFDRVAEAYALLRERKAVGKIVVTLDHETRP